jgi:hypothetical protein
MIASARYSFLLISFQLLYSAVSAQMDTAELAKFVPPLNRQLFHDQVNVEQKKALSYDGKADNQLIISNDEEINYLTTEALATRIDWIQYKIEKDSLLSHGKRIYYLKGMQGLLKNLQTGWRTRQFNPANLPAVVDAFEHCMALDQKKLSIENYINGLSYQVAAPVVRSSAFDDNAGIKAARNLLILKYCLLHPKETFITLRDNTSVPFADSLIKLIGRKYPAQLYSYAQAGNRLGALIHNINDDVFVKTIATMSKSRSGQQYFPFLDNIVNGKIAIQQIDAVKDDSLQYYRLLVNTQMDYVKRFINGDTAFEFRSLTERLSKKAKDVFVNTINGLHNESDAVRFRCLQPLNAQELYYLAVLTDGLIYTSSYTNGVYPLMMQRINKRGDSLLMVLNFDHYRKFISQAAAYNTLSNFLSSFPKEEDAATLMQAFVGRLEKSEGLEDGVDVADSYASIIETNPKLAANVLNLVKENYQRNVNENNKKGVNIYNILYKLFLSADSSNNIDLTKELGIPPVYNVPFTSLTNKNGEVIAQVFFYGDKDGQGIFVGFQNMFSAANWKIDRSNPQWITIKSIKGNPVTIYANKPLPEETGEDDKAQQALRDYLEKNGLNPSVTIHRGHSYFANSTISYMAASSRIVFMGSCGGFNLIDSILHKSTDAHIIASKQIGKTAINKPFFQLLTEKLRTGSNIDWIPFWREFKNSAKVEGFEDYIPPYKNLGAIFIKAYRKAMGEDEEESRAF